MDSRKIMGAYTKACKLISIITGSRKLRNKYIRERLKPFEFSILCNNCIGGVFLHDAGKRFNSPMVNLATDGDGFMALLENPRKFVDGADDFVEYVNPNNKAPHGLLHGVMINFVHYHSYEEAVSKWKIRGGGDFYGTIFM